MYFALKDDGLALSPDVVILGFFANDIWRNERTYYCFEKPRFSRGPDGWYVENQPVPTPAEVYQRYREMPLIYAGGRVLLEKIVEPPPPPPSAGGEIGEDRTIEILGRIRQLTADAGARFVMVDIPEHLEDEARPGDVFHHFCDAAGAECVETLPLFREMAPGDDAAALRARYFLPANIHYARAGYAVVAEALRRHFAAHPIVARPSH
jgi:hypothetical protein